MAKWEYRGKANAVSVYQIVSGKLVRLPRNKTRHLDRLPEDAIDEWVARWSALNEISKVRPDLAKVPTDWQIDIKAFETYLKAEKKRDPKTIKDHVRHLNYALPFFAEQNCQTYTDFLAVARELGPWLLKHANKSPRRIYAINQSIGVFWKYLNSEKDLNLAPIAHRLKGGEKPANDDTPLKFTITPADILAFNPVREEIRFFALVGYFCSLRPQEIPFLTPAHFLAGKKVIELDAGKTMEEAGLYNRFAVYVEKQIASSGEKAPKNDSKGWVCCFNKEAAKEIIKIISTKPREEPIIKIGIDHMIKIWSEAGYPDTEGKDMRRSSLYWLGHFTKLPPIAIKNHARHKQMSTTMLYVRRPENVRIQNDEDFDLDD